jgi:hypothetical protein
MRRLQSISCSHEGLLRAVMLDEDEGFDHLDGGQLTGRYRRGARSRMKGTLCIAEDPGQNGSQGSVL